MHRQGSCRSTLTYGVSFYGVGGTQAVSGGLGNPAKYNADGTKCDAQNQTNCPLEVETWFQPICNVGKDCAKADDLLVFFSVKSAANAQYQVKTISNIGTPTAYSTLTRVVEPPPPDVLAGGGGGGGNFSCFSFTDGGLSKPFCCTMLGNTLACTEVVKQANVAAIEGGPQNAAFYAGSLSEKFGTWKKRGYVLGQVLSSGAGYGVYRLKDEVLPSLGAVGEGPNEQRPNFSYRAACPELSSACLLPPPGRHITCTVFLRNVPASNMERVLKPNESLAFLISTTVSDVYECKAAP
ncbi:MAG: hypothetical protein IPK04_17700 [Bdellovibrionales bacterium]|nr:hypothetical protein [Bdellovibrionales bacterium]